MHKKQFGYKQIPIMPSSDFSLTAKLGRHSVAFRLWAAVAATILALLASTGFSALRSAQLQAASDEATALMDAKQAAANRWLTLTAANVVRIQASAASSEAALEALFKEEIASVTAEVIEVKKSIDAMPLNAQDRRLLDEVAATRKTMLDSLAKLRALKRTDADAARQEMTEGFSPAVAVYMKSLRAFAEQQAVAKRETQAIEAAQHKTMTRLVWLFVALNVLALMGGALVLIRSIQRPLAQAMAVAEQIAGGNLSARAQSRRRDEFGLLLGAMDRMVLQLRGVVGEVKQGIESVATASSQIATGNHDLSARTEQTASNLQQTASSMEQLTATVGHSADTARAANQLATSAVAAATRGGEVVAQVEGNMSQITESSRKIGDIIGVIDSIAFQTNILALNAAVEAARAGEQGRGFAVVASEVRALAQRSAGAAREIKALIGVSVERVETGAQLVAQTGAAMQDIVGSVRRVNDLIAEIAAGALEQRDGISQVNGAVTQLDQMTQQNAALVEESAAAAQSLREQAQRLAEAIAVFRAEH